MTVQISNDFGVGDSTYVAAGGLEGITRIVNKFYDNMDTLPQARELRSMHGKDLTESRKKLIYFLSGWMGGPKLYAEHFGPISIPKAHSHLPVSRDSKNSWLLCMKLALEELDYPEAFRDYLLEQLERPAESIRLMSEYQRDRNG